MLELIHFSPHISRTKRHNIYFSLCQNMYYFPSKASEEILPNEPEDYRPPAELYPYLTNAGEIYEGEKSVFNCWKEPEYLHDWMPYSAEQLLSACMPSVTFQTIGGPSTLTASSQQTLTILQWIISQSFSLYLLNNWSHPTATAASLCPFTWTHR